MSVHLMTVPRRVRKGETCPAGLGKWYMLRGWLGQVRLAINALLVTG